MERHEEESSHNKKSIFDRLPQMDPRLGQSTNQLDVLLRDADAVIWKAIRKKKHLDKAFRFVSCDAAEEIDDTDAHSRSTSPTKPDVLDGITTEKEPKRSPILQMTLLPNGFTMKLLPLNGLKVNGNNGTEGTTSTTEVFLPYEHGVSDESGLLEYIDSGLTPPILLDVLNAKFPSRFNIDDFGQEVDILIRDLRFLSKEKKTNLNHHSSEFDSLTRQVRLRSNNMTIQKIVRHKIISLNQANRTKNHLQRWQQLHESPKSKTNKQMNGHANLDELTSLPTPAKKSKKKESVGTSSTSTLTTAKKPKDLDSYQSLLEEEAEAESIESQVILNSANPLCLDPSPLVHLVENKLTNASRLVSSSRSIRQLSRKITVDERRILRKRQKILARRTSTTAAGPSGDSSVATNGSNEETDEDDRMFVKTNPFLKVGVFLPRKRPSSRSGRLLTPSIPSFSSSVLHDLPNHLPSSEASNVADTKTIADKIADLSQKLRSITAQINKANSNNDESKIKIEEYFIEFETPGSHLTGSQSNLITRDHNRPPQAMGGVTCVSIYQRQLDDFFFGQLYVDRQTSAGDPQLAKSSSSSKSGLFPLGTRESAKRYLEQFKEILTENGRKSVRISRNSCQGGSSSSGHPQQHHHHQPRSQSHHPVPVPPPPSLPQMDGMPPPQSHTNYDHGPRLPQQPTPPPPVHHQVPNIQMMNPQLGTTKVVLPSTNITLQPHPQAHVIRQPPPPSQSVVGQKALPHVLQPNQQISVQPNQVSSAGGQPHQSPMVQQTQSQQTPMICQMLSGSTLQAVLTSQPATTESMTQQQHPTLLQAIQPTSGQILNQTQTQRIVDGNTHHQQMVQLAQINPSQLRSIQAGGQSWLVLPPNAGAGVPTSATIGQGNIAQSQNTVGVGPVNVSVPQGSFRPVHVILWPQQGQAGGPGQGIPHQIVSTASSPSINLNNININLSSIATPTTVTINASSSGQAILHHQMSHASGPVQAHHPQ